MKRITSILPVSILLLTTGIISCTNSPESKTEKADGITIKMVTPEAALDQAKLDSATEYLNFKKQTEITIDANEQLIAELTANMKLRKDNINAQYEKDLEQLKTENLKLKKSMEDFSYGTTQNWEAFKSGVIQDIDKIGKSISELAAKAEKKS